MNKNKYTNKRTTEKNSNLCEEKLYTCEPVSERKNNANDISIQGKVYDAYDRYKKRCDETQDY